MRNPWTILKNKGVYDNPWIHVTELDVITPGGTRGIYGKVHFKNYAIGIIPLTAGGETVLVGQYRLPLNTYSWEIPMGGGLIGKDILTSAQRELQEETGITATEWNKILDIHPSNSVTDETGMVFVARKVTFGPRTPEDTEDITMRKIPFTQAFDMVMDGEITDAISVAGILKLKVMLNNEQ